MRGRNHHALDSILYSLVLHPLPLISGHRIDRGRRGVAFEADKVRVVLPIVDKSVREGNASHGAGGTDEMDERTRTQEGGWASRLI